MRIDSLHLGQQVRHPQYGVGVVKALNEQAATIQFSDDRRQIDPVASGLEPAQPVAELHALTVPVEQLIRQTVEAVADAIGLERPQAVVHELGRRWHGGTLILKPGEPSLQPREVPLESFFHKIVLMRNQLRTLEQKVNAHPGLTDGDKVELQQYISRCYGSMTTFNLLFQRREDQFTSGATG